MGEVLNFRALLKLSPTNVWFLRLTKVIVALLAPTKEDTLCDVGCGAGQRVLLLAQYVKQAVGMDISQPVIDFLNQKTRRNNVSFHLVDATVEPPQEFVGAFHKCLCMDVLEHVEQPELVLNFINRITRPGGWVVIGLPINADHEKHQRHFTNEDVYRLASGLDMETQVILLKLSPWGYLIDRGYAFLQSVLKPPKGGDYFHQSVAFEMLTKPRRIHNLYKLVTIFLFWVSQNSYREARREDKVAGRAFILGRKRA